MATTADLPAEATRLDMGWVVNATLRVLARRWLALLVIGLPFIVLPTALASLAPEISVLRLVGVLPGPIFVGAATTITYHELVDDDPVGIGEAISEGFGNFAHLWGISILANLAGSLGLLLLVVPGLVVFASCASAPAASVIEEMRVGESLDRSWSLARGSRWRLVGLQLLLLLVLVAIFLALATPPVFMLDEDTASQVLDFISAPLLLLAIQALITVGSAAAYVGLRRAKEGVGAVAAVFG